PRAADLRDWTRRVPCSPVYREQLVRPRSAGASRLNGCRFHSCGFGLPIGDIQRERMPLVLADATQLVADLERGIDDSRIPLLTGAIAQNGVELFVGNAFSVGPIAGHCI